MKPMSAKERFKKIEELCFGNNYADITPWLWHKVKKDFRRIYRIAKAGVGRRKEKS